MQATNSEVLRDGIHGWQGDTDGALALTADFTEEQFDRAVAMNLKSVWLCLRAEITQMLSQPKPGGAIEEAAAAAVWLCSEAASYVTGHSMIVDGGMTASMR